MLVLVAIFIIVPVSIYFIVDWNPLIGTDEEGEPIHMGFYVIIGLVWVATYIDYKRYRARKKLNELLDRLFDEGQTQKIFERIKERQLFLKKKDAEYQYEYKEGEDRLEWLRKL